MSVNPGFGGQKFIDSIFSAFFILIILISTITFFIVPWLIKILLPGYVGYLVSDVGFLWLIITGRQSSEQLLMWVTYTIISLIGLYNWGVL